MPVIIHMRDIIYVHRLYLGCPKISVKGLFECGVLYTMQTMRGIPVNTYTGASVALKNG